MYDKIHYKLKKKHVIIAENLENGKKPKVIHDSQC